MQIYREAPDDLPCDHNSSLRWCMKKGSLVVKEEAILKYKMLQGLGLSRQKGTAALYPGLWHGTCLGRRRGGLAHKGDSLSKIAADIRSSTSEQNDSALQWNRAVRWHSWNGGSESAERSWLYNTFDNKGMTGHLEIKTKKERSGPTCK